MSDPVTPSRTQLAKVADNDFETTRALERLFEVSGTETPDAIDNAVVSADIAGARASQALGSIQRTIESLQDVSIAAGIADTKATQALSILAGIFTGFSGHFLPSIDDTYDLGSSSFEWRNLYIDGIAYIDDLRLNDNEAISFGDNQDATVLFDGNSLNIVANAVTAGDDLILTANLVDLGSSPMKTLDNGYFGNTYIAEVGEVSFSGNDYA